MSRRSGTEEEVEEKTGRGEDGAATSSLTQPAVGPADLMATPEIPCPQSQGSPASEPWLFYPFHGSFLLRLSSLWRFPGLWKPPGSHPSPPLLHLCPTPPEPSPQPSLRCLSGLALGWLPPLWQWCGGRPWLPPQLSCPGCHVVVTSH